jgi:hypothetical protein
MQIGHGKEAVLWLFYHTLLTICLQAADFIDLIGSGEGPSDAIMEALG